MSTKKPVSSPLLDSIPGIVYGFGTYEESIPANLRDAIEETNLGYEHVHGVAVAEVTQAKQDCGKVDGSWTSKTGLTVSVETGDCCPILLRHVRGEAVAALHSGWRGTKAEIVHAFFDQLGQPPSDWVAVIGPCIGPCCYQVSRELALEFQSDFKRFGFKPQGPEERYLDLAELNRLQLLELGVSQVEVLRYCTGCSLEPRFSSYRREGKTFHGQVSGIMKV